MAFYYFYVESINAIVLTQLLSTHMLSKTIINVLMDTSM